MAKKIISKKYAQKLIRQRDADISCELRPDDKGDVYVALVRYDQERIVHYLNNDSYYK